MAQKLIFVQKQHLTPQCIVLIGGPGTGKSTLINALADKDFPIFEEVSRQVTREAQQQGIEQLFLTEPLLFSQKLLEGRIAQFEAAKKIDAPFVFLDRGIPDVLAYLDHVGQTYPISFVEACRKHRYDRVFELFPWRDIHVTDGERYEDFETGVQLHRALEKTYTYYGYKPCCIPQVSVQERADFLLKTLAI